MPSVSIAAETTSPRCMHAPALARDTNVAHLPSLGWVLGVYFFFRPNSAPPRQPSQLDPELMSDGPATTPPHPPPRLLVLVKVFDLLSSSSLVLHSPLFTLSHLTCRLLARLRLRLRLCLLDCPALLCSRSPPPTRSSPTFLNLACPGALLSAAHFLSSRWLCLLHSLYHSRSRPHQRQ